MLKLHFKQAAVLFLLPVLFLGHCKDDKVIQYSCENGAQFVVIMRCDGDRATLSYHHKRYNLRHIPAASGAKYSNGRITYWSKGSEAILIIDGKIVCRGHPVATR